MGKEKTLKAGALNYAILLSIIAATIILLLLVWQEKQDMIRVEHKHLWELRENCYSGWALLQSVNSENEFLKIEKDLFEDGRDSVTIISRKWGAYQSASIIAKRMGHKVEKSLIYGSLPDPQLEGVALYSPGNRNPIYVSGNTKIYGDVVVPLAGIKAAFIEGKYFKYKEFVQGKVEKSEILDIKISKEEKAYFNRISQFDFLKEDSLVENVSIKKYYPWSKPTIVYEATSHILNYDTLMGNMIVYNKDSLIIDSTCLLMDILITAPKVIVKSKFKGRIHIIATDSIIIEKNTILNYPSSLILFNTDINQRVCVQLKEGTQFSGVVLCEDKSLKFKNNSHVKLDSGSVFIGQIIANRNVEPRGVIKGQLFTRGIGLQTKVGIYYNHLLDCEINKDSLDVLFAGSSLLGNKKHVATWVN